MKILLIAVNAKYIHSNLAVYNLQKVTENLLREKGVTNQLIEVEICEYTINNRCEEVIHDIYSKHADLLAFSVYIWNVEFICQVANTLRCIQPEVPIWAGGPEVSYRPTEFLELYPAFTTILCGEGERIFSESIYEFYNGGKIPQIVYEDKIINMDCLPFVYPDLDTFNHRIIYYESSRGCPFSCSYCLSSIDKRTRYRNIELVKNELQYFIDKKVPLVKFIDRTFNSSHKHAMNIWEYILENDNNTTSFHLDRKSVV